MPKKDPKSSLNSDRKGEEALPDSSTEEFRDIIIEAEGEETSTFKGKSEKKLRTELKQAHSDKQEYLEGWQRAKADLINFRKEAEEERAKFAKFANRDFITQLIPVLDSFEAAISHGAESGTMQIYVQLLRILKQNGAEEICPEGEKFDPNIHDSIDTVNVESKKEDQKIIEVIQKGYKLHDTIIRAPRVRVGEFKK